MQMAKNLQQARLKQHLVYDGWKYALVIAICWFGLDLLYTTTAYRSPQDKRIDVMIMSATALGAYVKRRTSYQKACEEGWAPLPTNDVQKAIWDKVHAVPKNPMKIEFDPKQGK